MPKSASALLVFVTCGSRPEAQRIARAVVANRLAACVNIAAGPVHSIYRWKRKVDEAKEWLLIMKTTALSLRKLEAEVKRMHSYEVPEFIALKIAAGSRDYLSWLAGNVR